MELAETDSPFWIVPAELNMSVIIQPIMVN